MTVVAIVLAGGRSSRFGADKLAALVGDRSLLAATVASVAGLADEVVIAGPVALDGLDRPEPRDLPITVVADREPFAGPLAALANVLAAIAPPPPFAVGLVVGGDMPRLVPAVLASMLDLLDVDVSVEAVLLGRPTNGAVNARRAVLPLALRLGPAARVARELVEAGDRSLQSLVDRLDHVELPAERWQALDPVGATFVDIDTPADLDRLR